MVRYESDDTATIVASWGELATALPVGTRVPLEGENAPGLVLRSGRAARIDDLTNATGEFAATLRAGWAFARPSARRSSSMGGCRGAMSTASLEPGLIAADTEARMGEFTHLVATAISNAEARSDLAASRPGSSLLPTTSDAASSATCTTERNSAWSTRSSR